MGIFILKRSTGYKSLCEPTIVRFTGTTIYKYTWGPLDTDYLLSSLNLLLRPTWCKIHIVNLFIYVQIYIFFTGFKGLEPKKDYVLTRRQPTHIRKRVHVDRMGEGTHLEFKTSCCLKNLCAPAPPTKLYMKDLTLPFFFFRPLQQQKVFLLYFTSILLLIWYFPYIIKLVRLSFIFESKPYKTIWSLSFKLTILCKFFSYID